MDQSAVYNTSSSLGKVHAAARLTVLRTLDPVRFTLPVLCQMTLTIHSPTPPLGSMLEWKGAGMQGCWSAKPFAVQLLEEHRNGKTVEQLVLETGIPAERIEMRLSAATAYLQRLSERGGTGALLSRERNTPGN